jgi:hypothetical protein
MGAYEWLCNDHVASNKTGGIRFNATAYLQKQKRRECQLLFVTRLGSQGTCQSEPMVETYDSGYFNSVCLLENLECLFRKFSSSGLTRYQGRYDVVVSCAGASIPPVEEITTGFYSRTGLKNKPVRRRFEALILGLDTAIEEFS